MGRRWHHSTVLMSTAVLRQLLLGGVGCSACAGRAAALVALASRLSILLGANLVGGQQDALVRAAAKKGSLWRKKATPLGSEAMCVATHIAKKAGCLFRKVCSCSSPRCGWPARPRRPWAASMGASSQLRSGCALTPLSGPSRPHRLGRQPSHCRLHHHRSHPRSSSLRQPRRR